MNIRSSLTRWPALVGLALLLVFAGGCSDRGKAKDEKERTEKRDIARVRSLADQLRRLDESLARLKQETDAQQSRINAVQADIAAARETLSELGLSYRPPAGDSAADDLPVAASSSDDQDDVRKRREKAENRTLDTLVILCFLAAVGAIGYSLWQRRPKDGGPGGEPAAAPEPVAPPPPGPPVAAPPAESPESAPYKEEPKGPPSAF